MKAISMEQKYKEHQDNIVTFNHVMNFPMGLREVRARAAFSTVFESNSLDWDLQLHKYFDRVGASRDVRWAVSLIGVGPRDLFPPIARLQFTLHLLDGEGNYQKTLKYFIDGASHRPAQDGRIRRSPYKEYTTDQNSEFCYQLREVVAECRRREGRMQLETRLEFRKNDFGDGRFLVSEGAPLVGDMKEFFFDSIRNSSRHDVKLKNASETQYVMTNKEMLCMASPFFRQQLKESTQEFTASADHIESVEICMIFLLTGRYKRPAQMSPRLALEVFQLAMLWKVFDPKLLKNSLERQLYEELRKNHEDFLYTCNLLVTTEEAQFVNVQTSCVANIIFYHFNEFVRVMIEGNHPLKERFSQRREFLRPSLTMQVKRGFVGMRETQAFIKYIPEIGQD